MFAEVLLNLYNRSYYDTFVQPIVSDTNRASKNRQHLSVCACVSEKESGYIHMKRKAVADKTATAEKIMFSLPAQFSTA